MRPTDRPTKQPTNYPNIVPLQIFHCWTCWTFEIWRSAIRLNISENMYMRCAFEPLSKFSKILILFRKNYTERIFYWYLHSSNVKTNCITTVFSFFLSLLQFRFFSSSTAISPLFLVSLVFSSFNRLIYSAREGGIANSTDSNTA